MANPGATGGTCERDEDGFFTKTVSWTDPAMTLAIKTWDLADGLKLATTNITKPFKMSKGFFIVFDISNPSTFENVLGWKKQIEQFRSSSDSLPPSIMLVGAKQDLTSSATITYATASGLAKEMQATYVEVSNVTGLGVTECFNTMIQMYFERQNERKRLKLKSSDSDVPIGKYVPRNHNDDERRIWEPERRANSFIFIIRLSNSNLSLRVSLVTTMLWLVPQALVPVDPKTADPQSPQAADPSAPQIAQSPVPRPSPQDLLVDPAVAPVPRVASLVLAASLRPAHGVVGGRVGARQFVPPPVGVRIKSSPEDVVAVGQLLNSVREEMVHMSGQLEAMKKIVESPCSQIPSVVSYAPFFIAVVAISCCLAVVITQSLVPQRETLSAPIDQMTAHLKRQKHYDFKTSLEVYGNQLNLLLGKMDDLKDSVINMKSMSDCDTLRQTILRLAIQVQNQNEVIERLQLKLKDPSAAQSAF
ncbi:hypothetical protein Pelo_12854 [Pelomyxa schiedti]|nr:hypothetical protein Pelo_12854 [Pelomyxa schiedti]